MSKDKKKYPNELHFFYDFLKRLNPETELVIRNDKVYTIAKFPVIEDITEKTLEKIKNKTKDVVEFYKQVVKPFIVREGEFDLEFVTKNGKTKNIKDYNKKYKGLFVSLSSLSAALEESKSPKTLLHLIIDYYGLKTYVSGYSEVRRLTGWKMSKIKKYFDYTEWERMLSSEILQNFNKPKDFAKSNAKYYSHINGYDRERTRAEILESILYKESLKLNKAELIDDDFDDYDEE